jgi:hypothetical protein
MSRKLLFVLLLATSVALAEATSVALAEDAPKKKDADSASEAPAKDKDQDKAKEQEKAKEEDPNLGMSILGNQEAPKALVIVPWKRSEIGASLGISTLLDDSRQPIDKEVFMRVLSYYEVRTTTTRQAGGAQPANAAHRRK